MDALERLERFLMAAGPRENPLSPGILKKESAPFVTISRQAGAGGHSLALALLNEMALHRDQPLFHDWHVLDREICQQLAENHKIKVSLNEIMSEQYRSELEDIVLGFMGYTPQSSVAMETFKIIRAFAAMGKVIIVGRGGACLTRGFPGGLHLRLVGSEERRIRKIQERFQMAPEEARHRMEDWDSARARLVKVHFNRDIDDALLYDAVWNIDACSLPEIAFAAVHLIERRSGVLGVHEASAVPTRN